MAVQENLNFSVLPWYNELQYQNHRTQTRLGFGNGAAFPLVCDLYKLPPFQVLRTNNLTGAITSFSIVRQDTGASTVALLNMTDTGLVVESFADYDLITYPGLVAMEDIVLSDGQHYAIMSDGTNTWYSEIFYFFSQGIARCMKLSWWHDEPFAVPEHHISYADPFINFVYLRDGKYVPTYEPEEEVNEVDGYTYPLYQISKKIYRMHCLLPEYLCDVFRMIEHHHFKVIEYDGITYNPVYFRIEIGEKVRSGHLFPVDIFFSPDTVVQTVGKVKPETEGFEYDQTEYDDSQYA